MKKSIMKTMQRGTGLISNQAITLISLVITIIILIILAGVAINLSIGENGIFKRVKIGKEQYMEAQAREKLETVLIEAVIEKETNENYNNKEFLDNMLEEKGMNVNENIVIVDNYNFKIDRETLKIIEVLGETKIKITANVQEYLGKNANEKYEASILLVVESNSNIQKVTIENPEGSIIEMQADEVKIGKDITIEFDKEYTVTVITEDGKKETRKIIEKTEEIIRTANELAEFRDKVNTGLTYEGKVIKLGNDIDLSSVCGENVNGKKISWEPIGKGDMGFHGTFDGQYHIIDNLYINSTDDYQGLFSHIYRNATITSVIIGENSSITGNTCVGAITGDIANASILNCGNNASVTGYNTVGGIVGCASINTNIIGTYNKGNIISKGSLAAGIIGRLGYASSTVLNNIVKYCYNSGNVTSEDQTASGICAEGSDHTKIYNCYNIGTITCKKETNSEDTHTRRNSRKAKVIWFNIIFLQSR